LPVGLVLGRVVAVDTEASARPRFSATIHSVWCSFPPAMVARTWCKSAHPNASGRGADCGI
jgi:hypothetical protein